MWIASYRYFSGKTDGGPSRLLFAGSVLIASLCSPEIVFCDMKPRISATSFLQQQKSTDIPLLDVRAPAEYASGHIPGALNMPLFTDAERAIVGTLYKQESREAAFLKGLDLIGPKMSQFVRAAKEVAPENQLLIHCWRGGMRSESMAWLYRTAGFEVGVLEGGYKGYRKQARTDLAQPLSLLVLGGNTGSGKTDILHALAAAGEQVIDLEGLAHHKGSAFGAMGQAPQPTTEQFENNLHKRLLELDPKRRIWVEDESRSIGKVFIADPFWKQMEQAPTLVIEVPVQVRVQRLVREYAAFSPQSLEDAFLRIQKRLGGLRLQQAREALAKGDFASTAEIALAYYDKAYNMCLAAKKHSTRYTLPIEQDMPAETAASLISFVHKNL